MWKEAESIKAKDRQGTRTDIQENFPGCDSGQVHDLVARRVGSGSGPTYEKAAKVVRLIAQEAELGRIETAKVLRKVLNEQSVDAAHILLKKPPQDRRAIANLIINDEAKSTKQAAQMIKQKTHAEFNDPKNASFAGFSIGIGLINPKFPSILGVVSTKLGSIQLSSFIPVQTFSKLTNICFSQ